jgi:hypothetical protein
MSITAERWSRLKTLFAQITDRPHEEWPAAVEQACGDDHALRAELESLLEGDRRASGFIAKRDLPGIEPAQ